MTLGKPCTPGQRLATVAVFLMLASDESASFNFLFEVALHQWDRGCRHVVALALGHNPVAGFVRFSCACTCRRGGWQYPPAREQRWHLLGLPRLAGALVRGS